jgi:hypothetical protein
VDEGSTPVIVRRYASTESATSRMHPSCPRSAAGSQDWYLTRLFQKFSRFIELPQCFKWICNDANDLSYECSAMDVLEWGSDSDDGGGMNGDCAEEDMRSSNCAGYKGHYLL